MGLMRFTQSGYKNGRPFESASAEIGERLIGLVERIARGFGDDADVRHEAKEIDSVLTRQIGDRYELSLFP
jgi:hypothetical protein